jgi:hypothetical protein
MHDFRRRSRDDGLGRRLCGFIMRRLERSARLLRLADEIGERRSQMLAG